MLMLLDHTLFDLGFVFSDIWFPDGEGGFVLDLCLFARYSYWWHPLRAAAHMLVMAGFIGTCGISCSFSRSNLRRGLKLAAIAAAISLVTWLMDCIIGDSQFFIRFGILHMLAVSIIVYWLLQRFGVWASLIPGLLIAAAGFFIDPYAIQMSGYIPFALGLSVNNPSADYFPLIPWLGWVLICAALGGRLYRHRRSLFPGHGRSPLLHPLIWLGRHALLVYILHQPLIYGLLYLSGKIFA